VVRTSNGNVRQRIKLHLWEVVTSVFNLEYSGEDSSRLVPVLAWLMSMASRATG